MIVAHICNALKWHAVHAPVDIHTQVQLLQALLLGSTHKKQPYMHTPLALQIVEQMV